MQYFIALLFVAICIPSTLGSLGLSSPGKPKVTVVSGELGSIESHLVNSVDKTWKRCLNVPVLTDVCVNLFIHEANLTAGLSMSVGNFTFYQKQLNGGKYCLTQDSLIKLVETMPTFLPYKSVIDEVLSVEKYLPTEVMSICTQVSEFQVHPLHACAELDASVLCWKSKCAWKGTKSFGCLIT